MSKPTVFISYSHKDEAWKDRLRAHLGVLEKAGRITIWDDRKIDAGDKWFDEIRQAIFGSTVAVCLISADYLYSDFCNKEEIPCLLEHRERDGMVLIPVLLRPCIWKAVPWLKESQMLPRDGKSISEDFKDREDGVFAKVAERIFDIIDNPDYQPPTPPPPRWAPPEKRDIIHLPVTGAELFGRQKELAMLDEAWDSEHINIISLMAWGGVGKSTLVNKWLERMASDNYRGARRVYGWSFYSQGTGERVTSADQFISQALTWFGDSDPTKGSPWDKGERLADLVRSEKTLLVLDGLEPLQSSYDYEKGKVKDPALAILISELARRNPGLCIITTREAVSDLAPFSAVTRQPNLEQISAEAGRALLRVGGVQGTDAELEAATRDFGYHALALNLLAAYLHEIPGHHISNASKIPDIDIPEEKGRHPRRVMAAFEQLFGDGPEIEILQILGLFDRPAESQAVAAIKAPPPISKLTEHIHELSDVDWPRLLTKLRLLKLVARESRHNPDLLDAHPLIREHFGEKLRVSNPDAWREAHSRLYEYYKNSQPKEYPETIEEMTPLFAAVAHGCQAGRYQEALEEVFYKRIDRGEAFVAHKLGAIGAVLATLSGFFDTPWRQPVGGLTEGFKAYVLGVAGFCLRALGRLTEAVDPMRAALETHIALKAWRQAARDTNNLSENYLTSGDLHNALTSARQSVELADRSGDNSTRMLARGALADALHQAGSFIEATTMFRKAEEVQKELQPDYPLLYSVLGFYNCDLLLNQGKWLDVQNRAKHTLKWMEDDPKAPILTLAVEHLSLGRALLLQTQQEGTRDFMPTERCICQAVELLRQAGTQHQIPRGLLARAELYRLQRKFEPAQRDLDEAMTIATRGGMRLHEADCHLEYARLYLAMGGDYKAKARESLAKAKAMINDMGYHRRDKEVEELEKQLMQGQ